MFDGIDESSKTVLQENSTSVIMNIIKQKILPHCAVIVSSRPRASDIFYHQVTTKIEILGFTTDASWN